MRKTMKEIKNKPERATASVLLQAGLLAIFTFFFVWVIYKPVTTYRPNESYKPVLTVTPKKALEFGGKPTPIIVGLYIHGFPDFEMVKDHFVIDLTVWFKFDPTLITLKRISNFTFEKTTILKKIQTNTKIEGNLFFVQYFMRISLKTRLEFENFPIDDHRVKMALINKGLTPSEAYFKSSKKNIQLNTGIHVPGWNIIDAFVETGYIKNKLDPSNIKYYPSTEFFIDFARTGIKHILSILLPLLVVFFVSLLTFTFESETGILGTSVGSISAILAHYFVIDRISPPSNYIMISDYLFLVALMGCSVVLAINIVGKKLTATHKNIISVILYITLILFILYLFLRG